MKEVLDTVAAVAAGVALFVDEADAVAEEADADVVHDTMALVEDADAEEVVLANLDAVGILRRMD